MQQYIRIFMALNSETHGYEYNGKTPGGRCLLESRSGMGKLVLWVQDLKPEVLYRVHLIFKDGSGYKGLPLCALTILSNGKAELRHTFNAMDIEGYGLSLDQCQAVAIIAGEGQSASSPLCGYRENPLSWRNGFAIMERNKVVIEVSRDMVEEVGEIREVEEVKPVEAIEVFETVEKISMDTSTKSDVAGEIFETTSQKPETPENIQESVSQMSASQTPEMSEETFESESAPKISGEIPVEIPREVPQRAPHPGTTSENALSPAFKQEVDAILNSHTHMHPFQKQNRHVNWVRISLSENLSLPADIRSLLDTPFVVSAYSRYSHLILGKTADAGVLRYYLGIPAAYDPEDKVPGFKQFKCSMDNEPTYGDYGYWLIFMS